MPYFPKPSSAFDSFWALFYASTRQNKPTITSTRCRSPLARLQHSPFKQLKPLSSSIADSANIVDAACRPRSRVIADSGLVADTSSHTQGLGSIKLSTTNYPFSLQANTHTKSHGADRIKILFSSLALYKNLPSAPRSNFFTM